MERADRLVGPWVEPSGYSLPVGAGTEGPIAYPLSSFLGGITSEWCLLVGNGSKGYRSFATDKLGEGRFLPKEGFRIPFPFHQGSVLPLLKGEYERLQAAYGR